MVIKDKDVLNQVIESMLKAVGSTSEHAKDVAEHMISADLSGVNTHGIIQLTRYVDMIKTKEIIPDAEPQITNETATSALIKGNWTFGQVVAKKAMKLAIQKAQESNIAVVGLVEASHIGRLGFYTEMAASEGMISLTWGGGYYREAPRSAPYGGRKGILDTNPIAIGFPSGEESPMMFDFATANISAIKVKNAMRRGETLPLGSIIDAEGNHSTNPADFYNGGAFLPFGGHKGYAFMMAAEFFGRIFTGADRFVFENRGGSAFGHQGVSMIVMKADLFQPYSEYAEKAVELEQQARAVPPAPGFKEVLVPGDIEVRTRAERTIQGIPIEESIWQDIIDTAASLGINIE